ncbi:hypothetical protein M0802_015715 [Mischocyttarus mexicanus]|nr:hypothetical protein M0802_015730 [Mischocyttarus mexicanus]KAI4474234.1 hypothetical protein M0802_015715 [Mischocyttarus mexicanus]
MTTTYFGEEEGEEKEEEEEEISNVTIENVNSGTPYRRGCSRNRSLVPHTYMRESSVICIIWESLLLRGKEKLEWSEDRVREPLFKWRLRERGLVCEKIRGTEEHPNT